MGKPKLLHWRKLYFHRSFREVKVVFVLAITLFVVSITSLAQQSHQKHTLRAFQQLRKNTIDTCFYRDKTENIRVYGFIALKKESKYDDFREYLQFKIDPPLKSGVAYEIKLSLTNGSKSFLEEQCHDKIGKYGIEGLGANFRMYPYNPSLRAPLLETKTDSVEIKLPMLFSEQIKTTIDTLIAKDDFEYMILGNFEPRQTFDTSKFFIPINSNGNDDVARYFLKNISILEIKKKDENISTHNTRPTKTKNEPASSEENMLTICQTNKSQQKENNLGKEQSRKVRQSSRSDLKSEKKDIDHYSTNSHEKNKREEKKRKDKKEKARKKEKRTNEPTTDNTSTKLKEFFATFLVDMTGSMGTDSLYLKKIFLEQIGAISNSKINFHIEGFGKELGSSGEDYSSKITEEELNKLIQEITKEQVPPTNFKEKLDEVVVMANKHLSNDGKSRNLVVICSDFKIRDKDFINLTDKQYDNIPHLIKTIQDNKNVTFVIFHYKTTDSSKDDDLKKLDNETNLKYYYISLDEVSEAMKLIFGHYLVRIEKITIKENKVSFKNSSEGINLKDQLVYDNDVTNKVIFDIENWSLSQGAIKSLRTINMLLPISLKLSKNRLIVKRKRNPIDLFLRRSYKGHVKISENEILVTFR